MLLASMIEIGLLTSTLVLLEFAVSLSEFADTIAALSVSDLSKQLTSTLSVLADVERLYKDLQDSQVKDDMVTVMGAGTLAHPVTRPLTIRTNSLLQLMSTADSYRP